jgi:hypothetical protein
MNLEQELLVQDLIDEDALFTGLERLRLHAMF